MVGKMLDMCLVRIYGVYIESLNMFFVKIYGVYIESLIMYIDILILKCKMFEECIIRIS
jgi:hypothetical protein